MFAKVLVDSRTQMVEALREIKRAAFSFQETLKLVLRHSRVARVAYYCELPKLKRMNLLSKFMFWTYTGNDDPPNGLNVPSELQSSFIVASMIVQENFVCGRAGDGKLDGRAPLSVPPSAFEFAMKSMLRTVFSNDEKVSEKQGKKLRSVLVELIKRQHDFVADQDALCTRTSAKRT